MRAFTHMGTFDGRSVFSTWVTRIAINSALTMMRRRRTRRELSLDDPVDPDNRRVIEMPEPLRNPEELCLETEKVLLVRQAIKRSPSKLRTAMELHQSQDCSMSELALLVGVSVPAMKFRLVTARLKIRDSLLAGAIVVEGYASAQDHDGQFALSRDRAILVSEYLHTHFHLDSRNVGVVSLKELPPAGLYKDTWDGVCMVILK